MPKKLLAEREAEKEAAEGKKPVQTTPNGVVEKVQALTAFFQEGIFKAVTAHIMCSNQVHHHIL